GALSLTIFKINPGVDFTSGSRVEIVSDEPVSTEMIEEDFASLNLEPKSIVISGENKEMAVSRFDSVLSEAKLNEVRQYFKEKYNHEPNISIVSPIVGEELVKNAVYAVSISFIGLIIYVTFRFELFFSFTSIVALLFDVFFALVVFSMTRLEFDLTIISALITIIGYSINNTIVVFDLIRENIRVKNKLIKSKKELAGIINRSLLQTIIRNINTTTTTLIIVFAFMVLGAESIFGFAVAIVVGLIAGFYSSLFLASQLWLVWRGKLLKKKPIDFRKKQRVEGPQV